MSLPHWLPLPDSRMPNVWLPRREKWDDVATVAVGFQYIHAHPPPHLPFELTVPGSLGCCYNYPRRLVWAPPMQQLPEHLQRNSPAPRVAVDTDLFGLSDLLPQGPDNQQCFGPVEAVESAPVYFAAAYAEVGYHIRP